MTSLHDWQREFMQALTADVPTLPAQLRALDADGTRLAIYRNNWRSNLSNALRIAYPVVEQLVGAEFFGYAARCFIETQPSRSANLDDYGREFPAFLRAFEPVQSLLYLDDVAALELAIDTLAASADDIEIRIDSPFPILAIWRSNQPGWTDDTPINLDAGADKLLVRREQGELVIERVGSL